MKWKLAATLIVGFLFGLAASLIARHPEAQAQAKAKTQRMEYNVYTTRGQAAKAIEGEINSNLADKDWEYVGPIWQTKDESFLLFKRPKK
jgi:hypothetical protein